jgi:Putative prokaryotic signal transducing protein
MAAPRGNHESDSVRDPEREKERWRLAWHYADMTDAELQSLAAESGSLTEVARRALQSELRQRRLPVELGEPQPAESAEPAASATVASRPRSRKLVTLCRFRDMPEALLAKSVLESAGIECLLGDANIIRTDWLWSNLVGGVKLRVLEEDLEEASRLLEQNTPQGSAPQGAGDFQPPRCPRCHSLEVSLDDLHDSEAAAGSSAGARPTEGDPGWTCQSCGNQWRELEPTG